MEDARKDAPMSGDNEREPETERSVEVAKVETAGDRAWQTWRAQLADVRAALDQWKVESAASTERWERLRDEAHARACGFLTESGFPNRLSSDSRCASGGLAMTRPYSEDLRERAVARFEAGETIRSIGKAFGIDPSCVPKWVKRRRETGSVAPAAIGGRKPRTLSGNVAVWLRERIHSGRFTTRGLAAELAERGIKTDRRAVWTFVREEGLSFKKKPVRQRAGSARRRAQT
jgi:putative transposase